MQGKEENRIIGYLQGSLSLEEREAFLEWVDADEANKELFFEIKAIYEACLPLPVTDMHSGWERLLCKRRQLSVHPINLYYRFLRYAGVAIFAVLVTSTCFLLFMDKEDNSQSVCFVSGNERMVNSLILPDGTSVKLGYQTSLSYNSDYGKKKRIVSLDGEAYFEVAKQKEKPFIVKVKGQEIEALGTRFNVLAYSQENVNETTLLEGSIRLTLDGVETKPVLSPGQQLSYKTDERSMVISDQVNTAMVTSWTQGYYSFSGESLGKILKRIGQMYDVSFSFQSNRLADRLFTGTFYRGQTIHEILGIINVSIPINYKIEEQKITINEKR